MKLPLAILLSVAAGLKNVWTGLRLPKQSTGLAPLAETPGFACQCFCATQKLSIDPATNIASSIPDSLDYAFEPGVIGLEGGLEELDTLPHTALKAHSRGAGAEKILIEFMTGVSISAGPDLTVAEQILLPQLTQHMGGTLAFQNAYIADLPEELQTIAESYLANSPFDLHRILVQPALFFLPKNSTLLPPHQVCQAQCFTQILEPPSFIKRLVEHTEFGILKRRNDPPFSGSLLSPERPQHALHKLPFRLMPPQPEYAEFQQLYKERWQALFIMASRWNGQRIEPRRLQNGSPDPADLALFQHLQIDPSLTCAKLRHKFDESKGRDTSWALLAEEFGITRNVRELVFVGGRNVAKSQRSMLQTRQQLNLDDLSTPLVDRQQLNLDDLSTPLVDQQQLDKVTKSQLEFVKNSEGAYKPHELENSLRVPLSLFQKSIENGNSVIAWPHGTPRFLIEPVTPTFRFRLAAAANSKGELELGSIYTGEEPLDEDLSHEREFLGVPISAQDAEKIGSRVREWAEGDLLPQLVKSLEPGLKAVAENHFALVSQDTAGNMVVETPNATQLILRVMLEYEGALYLNCWSYQKQDPVILSAEQLAFVMAPVASAVELKFGSQIVRPAVGARGQVKPPAVRAFLGDKVLDSLVTRTSSEARARLIKRNQPLAEALFKGLYSLGVGVNDNALDMNTCAIARSHTGSEILSFGETLSPSLFPITGQVLEAATHKRSLGQSLDTLGRLLAKCRGRVLPGAALTELVAVDPKSPVAVTKSCDLTSKGYAFQPTIAQSSLPKADSPEDNDDRIGDKRQRIRATPKTRDTSLTSTASRDSVSLKISSGDKTPYTLKGHMAQSLKGLDKVGTWFSSKSSASSMDNNPTEESLMTSIKSVK